MQAVQVNYNVKDIISEEERRNRMRDYGLRRKQSKRMNPLDLFKASGSLQPAPIQQTKRPSTAASNLQSTSNMKRSGKNKNEAKVKVEDINDSNQEGALATENGNAVDFVADSGQYKMPVFNKRPSASGATKRANPLAKVTASPPKWNSSSICPDRDMLVIEQDAGVERYRTRNPENYPDHLPSDGPVEPVLNMTRRKSFEKMTRRSFDRKTRVFPQSVGALVNHDHPFYPELKELANHGIHDRRWHTGTVKDDSVASWGKPAQDPRRCDQDKFWNSYGRTKANQRPATGTRNGNIEGLRKGSKVTEDDDDELYGDKVEVYRHMSSIATVASRRSKV